MAREARGYQPPALETGVESPTSPVSESSGENSENERWQKDILNAVDQHAQNLTRLDRVRNSAQEDMDNREAQKDERQALFDQIANGQDIVRFNSRSCQYFQLENGNVLVSASEGKKSVGGVVQSDANFNASLELQRQEIESLYSENKQIEEKFGGSEKFAEIQRKVEEIRKVEQELVSKKSLLENEVLRFSKALNKIGNHKEQAKFIYYYGGSPENSQDFFDQQKRRWALELSRVEANLKEFNDETKPKLVLERDRLLGELKKLFEAGKKEAELDEWAENLKRNKSEILKNADRVAGENARRAEEERRVESGEPKDSVLQLIKDFNRRQN